MRIDHIGLTVSDLKKSVDFFVECLGWNVVGGRPSYPATYLAQENTTLTLWQVCDVSGFRSFDRRLNVGLHHLAFRMDTLAELEELHSRVSAWDGVEVEFGPELSGAGPKMHSMFCEPGGCRIELSWDPRK